jgi:hypothetical protein
MDKKGTIPFSLCEIGTVPNIKIGNMPKREKKGSPHRKGGLGTMFTPPAALLGQVSAGIIGQIRMFTGQKSKNALDLNPPNRYLTRSYLINP